MQFHKFNLLFIACYASDLLSLYPHICVVKLQTKIILQGEPKAVFLTDLLPVKSA
jgi:hypothetical protein